MRNKDDGGPAYPVECRWAGGELQGIQTGNSTGFAMGMSLRDAMALSVRMPDEYSASWAEAILGEKKPVITVDYMSHAAWWMRAEAAYRYRMADAMLEARGK